MARIAEKSRALVAELLERQTPEEAVGTANPI
jgi:hypothetical protein